MKTLTLGTLAGAASLILTGNAVAARHPGSISHHYPAHHASHASAKHHAAPARHAGHHHAQTTRPNVPAGAVSVPAGGIKLSCGSGRNPLMVRKMTQGNGTTVTVICR